MHFQAEAWALYRKALSAGRKNMRRSVKQGTDPYLRELDSFLEENMVAGRIQLGALNIPTESIVGIADRTGKELYAYDFMPLSSADSEFADQWRKLYLYYLSDKEIRSPITCYEYLGRFYVLDGKKRVSVAKSHGAPTITASVTRILPVKTEDAEIQRYYEFMQYFELTQLYQISFTQPDSFVKFQKALGFEENHAWNEGDRFSFLFNWYPFEHAFHEAFDGQLNITTADALLVLLEDYPYSKLKETPSWTLTELLRSAWKKLYKISNPDFIITPEADIEKAS